MQTIWDRTVISTDSTGAAEVPPEPAGCLLSGAAGNVPVGCQESCSRGAVSLEASYLICPRRCSRCSLSTAGAMQGLGAGETTCPMGTRRQRSHQRCRRLPSRPTRTRKQSLLGSLSSTFYRQSLMSCQLAKSKYLKGPDAHLGANKKVESGDERRLIANWHSRD